MVRDFDRLEESKQFWRDYGKWSFDLRRSLKKEKALSARESGNMDRYNALMNERAKIKLDESRNSGLSYGQCVKFDKPVSFLPNTCMLETQSCFEHRKN